MTRPTDRVPAWVDFHLLVLTQQTYGERLCSVHVRLSCTSGATACYDRRTADESIDSIAKGMCGEALPAEPWHSGRSHEDNLVSRSSNRYPK